MYRILAGPLLLVIGVQAVQLAGPELRWGCRGHQGASDGACRSRTGPSRGVVVCWHPCGHARALIPVTGTGADGNPAYDPRS